MSSCCVTDLHCKEVINQKNGCRLGRVNDVEIDTCTSKVTALIIYGRQKCFGLLGRDDDIRIEWENIKIIGDDTILVCYNGKNPIKQNKCFNWASDII